MANPLTEISRRSGLPNMSQDTIAGRPDQMAQYRNALVDLLSTVAPHLVGRGYQQAKDPVGSVRNAAVGAAGGIAAFPDDIAGAFGGSLYSPDTRSAVDELQSADQAAAFASPMLLPLATAARGVSRTVSKAPVTSTAVGATGATIAGSAEAGGDGTGYQKRMMDFERDLSQERQRIKSLEAERSRLLSERDDEGRTGKGSKWKAADERFRNWEATNGPALQDAKANVEAIRSRMEADDKENSPAAVRSREAKQAETDRQTPTRELYPWAGPAALAGGALLGLGAGVALKGKAISKFNKNVSDATGRLDGLTDEAKAALETDPAKAALIKQQITATQGDLERIGKNGVGWGAWAAPPTGSFVGTEVGANIPTIIDYSSSQGQGDPLYDKAIESVAGGKDYPWQNLVNRTLMTGIPAIAGGKLAGMYQDTLKAGIPARRSDITSVISGIEDGSVATSAGKIVDNVEDLQATAARGRANAVGDLRNASDARSARQSVALEETAANRVREAERAAIDGLVLDPGRSAALQSAAASAYGSQFPTRNAPTFQQAGQQLPLAASPNPSNPLTALWPGGKTLQGGPIQHVNATAQAAQQFDLAPALQRVDDLAAQLGQGNADLSTKLEAVRSAAAAGSQEATTLLRELQDGMLLMGKSGNMTRSSIDTLRGEVGDLRQLIDQRIPQKQPRKPPAVSGADKMNIADQWADGSLDMAAYPPEARMNVAKLESALRQAGGKLSRRDVADLAKSGVIKFSVPAAVGAGSAGLSSEFTQLLEQYGQTMIDIDGDGIPDVVVGGAQ